MPLSRWTRMIPGAHPGSSGHVGSCADCRGRLETERRYLAALREAQIPRASSSLQERLLEQTRHLAAQAEVSDASRPRARAAARTGLSMLAGAAAATAALAVTAYTVAGEPPAPSPAEGSPAALVRTASGSAVLPPGPVPDDSEGEGEAAAGGATSRAEDPLERIGRGLRLVFGASGRP